MPKQGRHRVLHHVPSAKRQAAMATPEKPWDPAPDPLNPSNIQAAAAGAAVASAAAEDGSDSALQTNAQAPSNIHFSKAEKRRLKKERFLSKLSANAMAKATAKPKAAEKKEAAPMGSFASLLETIAEVDTVPKEAKTPRVTNRDQRERIVKKELDQLRKVTAHTSFQKNPLDIIKQHLTNTIEQQQKDEYKRLREIKQKKKNEKRQGNPAPAPNHADHSRMQT